MAITVSAVKIKNRNTVEGLNLPREAWSGGPAYWSQFSRATAAGWTSSSWFPFSVFFAKPDQSAQLHSYGINLLMGAEHDGSTMASITNTGMQVLAQQNEWTTGEVGSNPLVVGWFISDECEMGYSGCPEGEYAALAQQTAWINAIRARADGRFVQANYGNGILRTFWASNTMDQFVQILDVCSADKYTYTSPFLWGLVPDSPDWPNGAPVARAASYGWQVDQIRSFQDPQNLKPIWTFIETAMPYLEEPGAQTITLDQLEGAVWSAIIHGALGVAYFQHNNNGICGNYSIIDCGAALQNRVTKISTDVSALAPIINTQSYIWAFNTTTDTMLKATDTHIWIFAGIGLLHSTGSKTFTLPSGVSGTTATVYGESRTVNISGGQFTDTFAAEHTHHIYQVAL